MPHLVQWLKHCEKEQKPIDAVCLQELKLTDDKFPHQDLEEAGYWAVTAGQKTYNGVALVVRRAALAATATDPQTTFLSLQKNNPAFADEQQRIIAATIAFKGRAPVRLISAYFPNGQAPGSDKFNYKLLWLSALEEWLKAELQKHENIALLGDYNIAPEDADVHDPAAWLGQNLVSPPEREAFKRLLELGFQDAFRLFEQAPKTFTWWDYRMMAFRRNAGLRIDHILLSAQLAKECLACEVDKLPRTWEQPSDHTPIIATLS